MFAVGLPERCLPLHVFFRVLLLLFDSGTSSTLLSVGFTSNILSYCTHVDSGDVDLETLSYLTLGVAAWLVLFLKLTFQDFNFLF